MGMEWKSLQGRTKCRKILIRPINFTTSCDYNPNFTFLVLFFGRNPDMTKINDLNQLPEKSH